MTNKITIQGILLTHGAAENVQMTSTDILADVERVRFGEIDFDGLLAECHEGLDAGEHATTMQHWLEYVEAVVDAAACGAKRVITYQYAYIAGSVELCEACASAWRGPALGPVSHGLHSAACGTRH